MRVLVIEDEETLLAQLQAQLQSDGYIVDVCADGKEGLYFATEYPLDAAIVDLGLPGLSGIEIIKHLREQGNKLPVLVLTARGRWQDKVEGLEAGADDYLVKPFQMEELQARLKALLRRSAGSPTDILECGVLKLNTANQTVVQGDQPVELTAFEYRLLEYFMRHTDSVVSKEELSDYLYPHDDDRDSNVIEVFIGRLRKKLDAGDGSKIIETLRGRGYRFRMLDPTD